MGKTIRFNENGLIAIKERLNEIMVGTPCVSHNDVCEEVGEEFAPVGSIGGEEKNGDVTAGGNRFHMEQVEEGYNYSAPQELIDKTIMLRDKYGTDFEKRCEWAVIDTIDPYRWPKFCQKKQVAIENAKWLRQAGASPAIVKLTRGLNEGTSFEEWFGNSILRNDDGTPMKMYHGTDDMFDSFSKTHIGSHGSYEGYGFNFTPDEHRARGYSNKNVIEAYLRVENPMTHKTHKITLPKLIKIISKLDSNKPFTDTIVAAYEPAGYGEKWDERYYRRALPVAARTIYNYNRENEGGDAGLYADICLCGNSDTVETISAFEELGFDSAMFYDSRGKLSTVVVFEPNQIKRTTNKTFNNDSELMGEDVVTENFEKEVESSEVDLSSFKKRDSLPLGIWKDEDTLDSRVRLKLLDIADDFWEFVNLTWVEPKGIIITGSICNFNWSKFSDIDLHLIVDFSEVDSKTEFVRQYLDSKKNEWNNEHEGLKIMGFPVELYVQDVTENPEAGGIYDLEENTWVRKPNPHTIKSIGLNKFNIKDKAAEIMTIIDDMYQTLDTTDDRHVIEQVGNDADYLWKKVKALRKKSLDKHGESGAGNIVYKVLRRTGYLDKLFKLFSTVYDRSNSITESAIYESTNTHKEILNEFLDKNYGIPLYRYFQWAEKASDRDKVEDLFYHCPWIIGKYLDNVSGYDEELSELEDELLGDRDLEYDEEYIERVLDALERHNLLTKLIDYPYAYAAAEELPAWFIMSFIRVVKNEWCIHFTSDANNIARKGFTGGTPEVEDIAYTNAGREKHFAGYDFAFLINDSSVDFNGYGDEAVIFRASGVLLLHYGDEQRQVVFWGPSVKELIPIKKDDYSSDWVIEGLNGQVFATGKPSELADWATDNLPQYRKQIVAGKSGYRPWGYSRPSYYNEYMKSPFSNESVKKYLTVLKEEVNVDGNTEHNPYEKRWKAERDALKNFVANYGKLMQSREDNKGGKLYKVYYDETMSNLIGYNYCIAVQYDEINNKPKSTVYVRALDKFTPFIRRNLQFDTRGRDNMRGTYDDTGY